MLLYNLEIMIIQLKNGLILDCFLRKITKCEHVLKLENFNINYLEFAADQIPRFCSFLK